MSQRAHFWIRVAGLAAILAAHFGPRLWSGASPAAVQGARLAVAVDMHQP